MAKGKHAAALFEVIHKDKRFAKKSSSGMDPMRTPTWWFKGRKESTAAPATPAPATPSPVAYPAPTPAAAPESHEAPMMRLTEFDPTSPEALAARAAHHHAPVMSVPESIPYEPAASRGAPNWSRRPEWLTRTSGAIIAGAAIAVIGLGVLVARHGSHAPQSADAETLTARPTVLDLNPNSAAASPAPTETKRTHSAAPAASSAHVAATPAAAGVAPQRQVNLNYCIVQGYKGEKLANEAAAFLNSHGIACTVETNLPRYGGNGWYFVVGLDGFTRISSPEYAAYRKKIESLSQQYASSAHSFKAFDPHAIKWDRGN